MIFIIGDVHGEITKLKMLLEKISKYKIEKLIFVGDYLDKGENSKLTLEFLNKLRNELKVIFLLGNHEFQWLSYLKNGEFPSFKKYGAEKTLNDFGIRKLDKSLVKEKLYEPFKPIFNSLKSHCEAGDYLICHSGIDPSLEKKSKLEEISDEKFLYQRYNFLKNSSKIYEKEIIFGHTAFHHPFYDGVKIGIDTGAAYLPDSALTAFELDSKFFINHMGEKVFLDKIDKSYSPLIIRNKPWRLKH